MVEGSFGTTERPRVFRYVIDNIFLTITNGITYLLVMLGHSFEIHLRTVWSRGDNCANGCYPSSVSISLMPDRTSMPEYRLYFHALILLFGRIALNWDNKYILNASLRSDGSSAFANKRYGYFPSTSLHGSFQ